MRKCDISGLPKSIRNIKGKKKEYILWKESIGCIIPFVYDEVESEVEVLDYHPKTRKLTLLYEGREYLIGTDSVLACGFSVVVGKIAKDYVYQAGQEISKNGKATILERFRKEKDGKNYKLKCSDCGQIFIRSERKIKNTEWGVKCCFCGDGISYPNKFMASVLTQLECIFKTEYIIPNSINRRYDFYIPSLNTVIEVHGKQHYERSFERFGRGSKTLEQKQENDSTKKKNALANGYNYIEINASKSEMSWIRHSIENSAMKKLFDLSKVDWLKCHDFATDSITKKNCSMFVENDPSISKKIGEELGLSYNTVTKHLKAGAELGWCSYNPAAIQKLNGANKGKSRTKETICIETGQVFESASECARVSLEVFGVKLLSSKISAVCNGVAKSHHGYTFRYVEDGGEDNVKLPNTSTK